MIATDRLDIAPWTHDDVDRLYDTYSRWEVARWLGATPRALADPAEAPSVVDRWAARCVGFLGVWAVRVRATGVIAGTVLLVPLPSTGDGDQVEVGWHLHPDSWGHGYATEAAAGAIAHGFAHGLTEIFAVVRPGNERSIAVCHRLGMTPLGRTTRWYDTDLVAFRTGARGASTVRPE